MTTKETVITTPMTLLRVEGLLLLIAALGVYAMQGYSWLAFAVFLFAPDLSILVYGVNEHVGAMAYNTVHTYALPLVLGVVAFVLGWGLGLQIALIWFAHISMDRMFGYGLKYLTGFKDTHLGRM